MATKNTTNDTSCQPSEWMDEMSYQAGKHIELGKARVHKLRGYKAKTRAAKAWADKQEVKAERQEVQLKTERTNLQTDKEKDAIATTNLKGTQADGVLNQISWAQKLTKKAYSVGLGFEVPEIGAAFLIAGIFILVVAIAFGAALRAIAFYTVTNFL